MARRTGNAPAAAERRAHPTGIQHAIVATADGDVRELWWPPAPPIFLHGTFGGG